MTRAFRGLAALLIAAPAGLAAWYIGRFGVNAAHWDHLTNAELFDQYYSGSLTIEYLFRPHLEHLKLFPRLICLVLGVPSGFDNRIEMYFQWLLLGMTAWVLFVALRRRAALPLSQFLFVFAPIPFALFNLRQHQSLLVGDGMITYVAIAAVTTSIVMLDGAGLLMRVVAGTAAAVVASFSHAAGLLLWPIGVLLLLAPGSASRVGGVRLALPIWVAAGAVVAAVYAWRLPPATAGSLEYAIAHTREAFGYVLAVSGAAFAERPDLQMRLGAVLLAAELGLLFLTVRTVSKGERVPFGVWLVVFAVGCRILLAAGRLPGMNGLSVPSRYAAFVSLGAAGLYAGVVEMRHRKGPAGRAIIAAALIVVTGSGLGYVEGLRAGPAERDTRLRIRQLLQTTSLQDDATLGAWLYPNPDHARAYARGLERHHLNVFAETGINTAALPRSADVQFSLDSINGAPVPEGSAVTVEAGAAIHVSGWAFEKPSKRLLGGVFVAVDGVVMIPAAYGMYRPDVAHRFDVRSETGFSATFSGAALGRGEHSLALHFVTGDTRRAVVTGPVATLVLR